MIKNLNRKQIGQVRTQLATLKTTKQQQMLAETQEAINRGIAMVERENDPEIKFFGKKLEEF